MGTLYTLQCSRCAHSARLDDGCGEGGCVENYYCPQCGRMVSQFHTVEEMQAGEQPAPAPHCSSHPEQVMRELTFPDEIYGTGPPQETAVPCAKCSSVRMVGTPHGIWD